MIWALSSYRSYELEQYRLKYNSDGTIGTITTYLLKNMGCSWRSQEGRPPNSHSPQMYGPGLEIFFSFLCVFYFLRCTAPVWRLFPFALLRKVDDVPEDGQHVLLRDHLDKGGQVEERRELGGAASKIELIGTRLVEVPWNVDVNCVQACSLVDIVGIIYNFLKSLFLSYVYVPCIVSVLFSNTVDEPWIIYVLISFWSRLNYSCQQPKIVETPR